MWIISAGLASALSVILMKYYVEHNWWGYVLAAIVSYCFVVFCYSQIFMKQNINVAYPLIKVCSILFVLFYSVFVFGEKLNVRSYLGIFFAILAMSLLI
jgi:multidrug transporter EmrE-like cation transporter